MRRTDLVESIEPPPLSSAVNGMARNLVSHKHLKKFLIARKAPPPRGFCYAGQIVHFFK